MGEATSALPSRRTFAPVAWIWRHKEAIIFLSNGLLVLLGFVGFVSLYYAAQSLDLQMKQYEEDFFNRNQGALNLAWRTLSEANSNPKNIGQDSAIKYLIEKGQLLGNLTMNKSTLRIRQDNIKNPLYADLSTSNVCGTDVSVFLASNSTVYLMNSLLRGSRLSGRYMRASFLGSDLQGAYFDNVRAPEANFVATNLSAAKFVGGSYERADFRGAKLRSIETYRGYEGAGTEYDDNSFGAIGYLDDRPGEIGAMFDSAETDITFFVGVEDTMNVVHLVDFRGAQFLNADLRGADLTNSTIQQRQVDEACVDDTTKLPKGVVVKEQCVPERWVQNRRELLQKRTYEGRSRALEECNAAVLEPSWK